MIMTLTLMMTQKKKELESSYDKQIGRVLHMYGFLGFFLFRLTCFQTDFLLSILGF